MYFLCMSTNTYVITLDLSLSGKLLQGLKDQEFEISTPLHTLFSGKKSGISCTLYKSGKLMVQGKNKDEFIEFFLEPEILQNFDYKYKEVAAAAVAPSAHHAFHPHIGIDESGKGDFFGPLCIAGVFATAEQVATLKAIGVKDSKVLNAAAITRVANGIRKTCAHHVVQINPAKYNELYAKFKNLNRLLAWGHATVIEQLAERTGCRDVLIDKFGSEDLVLTAIKRKDIEINLTQRTHAEEDLVVAAASILARDAFVKGIEKLAAEYGVKLPKGASAGTVAAGRAFVSKHGQEMLGNVAKLHFKTTGVVLN